MISPPFVSTIIDFSRSERGNPSATHNYGSNPNLGSVNLKLLVLRLPRIPPPASLLIFPL
jgi:hypothetical protein